MTIEAHVDQLNSLVTELDIKEFYLYGHSWGTILGLEYYLKYPTHVKGMIQSSPCLNLDLWLQDADTLITSLPDSIQFFLKQSIRNENTDSLRMKESIDLFYNTFYTRRKPLSQDMQMTISEVGFNVYKHMWGKEDYVLTGTLKGYDRTDQLSQIMIPTLYLTGEFDAARPVTVKHYHDLTPNSTFHIINNAGHQTVHDNPKETISEINNFLSEIENN
jgi:proline iminopeptidase